MNVSREPDIQQVLARAGENGGPFWSREDGNIHAPAGFSTIDVLNVLGELGATVESHPRLAEAIEFVFGYQAADGAFRYSSASSKFPCMTGQILAGLGRLGALDGSRCPAAFSWLLDNQSEDGGWRCATVKLGKSPETDAANPGATLYVLDAFRHRPDAGGDRLDYAVESLLHHWETREPLGPCAFGIGSRFLRVEYPFLRYNLFYYVYVLSHYPSAVGDRRFQEAVRALAAHAREGQMIVEAPHRKWLEYDFARKGRPSAPATARWREIQARG
ncbi:prenyltransferase/squalene oxidase repeat-containing protein [Amycolatopsis alkalitolerans]|uniref:Terpene cyclase/mutase family protein n=1 Tax=Amycolatopsis alkalitolerans TaxID=2547244 RepID=A0A5C4LW60_9PSEU|nr:terpene cyclase/mutase family protein [Amycolatopsis alkalitolerans]TNC23422.1 terpene cyclase/mutase family protein [Amycolatopsis alkalitolerans]